MGSGWRLFERFEERVLRRLVHAIGALDERDAAATLYGEEGEASGERADRLDADLVRRPCWRDDDEVGVAPGGDEAAGTAGATGPAVNWRTTHERYDGVTGERPRTGTTRPNNQQGVWRCVGEERGEVRRGGVMTTGYEACGATRRVSGVRRR
jgi:hypothetical protein